MKKKITFWALAGIMAGTVSQNAWADNIERIIINSDAGTVEVSGTLSGCTDPRPITPVESSLDVTYFLDLFAGPLPLDADVCETTFSETYPLPAGQEFGLLTVSLFSGEPTDVGLPAADSETVALPLYSGDAQCQDECWMSYDLCLTDCALAADVELCMNECETARATCLSDCGTVETTVLCTPETLNLASKGRWVTCKLYTEADVALEDIDTASLLLNGEIYADRAVISDDGYLNIKFSRAALVNMFNTSVEPLTFPLTSELLVTGTLLDGRAFTASDTVRVIKPVAKKAKKQKKIKKTKRIKNTKKVKK